MLRFVEVSLVEEALAGRIAHEPRHGGASLKCLHGGEESEGGGWADGLREALVVHHGQLGGLS